VAPAAAASPVCTAVSDADRPATASAAHALDFACGGAPSDYRDRRLWLRLDARLEGPRVLRLERTRFDALSVHALYADGHEVVQRVRSGERELRWSIGGFSAFELPARAAPLRRVLVAYDGLASHHLLRKVEIVPAARHDAQTIAWAVLVGAFGGIMLSGLLFAGFLRRRLGGAFVGTHIAWLSCTLLWGLSWSGVLSGVVPSLSGTWGVRLNSVLAGLAVFFAARFFLRFIEREAIGARVRRSIAVAAAAVPPLSLAAAWDPLFRPTERFHLLQEATIALTIVLVIAATAVAWRRGSASARLYAYAWAPPVAAILWRVVPTFGIELSNAQAEMAIMGAAALQAVLLGIAITGRLSRLRRERDDALEQGRRMKLLAETDPLTGLLNRRGFVGRAEAVIATAPRSGLILLDIDHFKAINDRHGHDLGDAVLAEVGSILARTGHPAGRLGGEEFGVVTAGVDEDELFALAEAIRAEVEALGPSDATDLPVTVSVGLATARSTAGFNALYRCADEALYRAKRAGRNQTVLAGAVVPALRSAAA